MDATAFAARPATDPGFIDFNVLAGPTADPVLIRAHHPRAELVEDLKRRLIARQTKLSLKLHGRHGVSGWTPDKQTKTIRSAGCASVP